MKKTPKHRRAKPKPSPPDPLAAQFAELGTRLVLLGASLYHAGMKQATPTAPDMAPQFSFAGNAAQDDKPAKDRLPEV